MIDMAVETWKEVPGYPTFDASTWGNILSYPQHNDVRCTEASAAPKLIGLNPGRDGYRYVNLCNHKNTTRRQFPVHRVILMTFVGPCPPGMQACHDPDPDRTNCRLDNLRWGTQEDNLADCLRLHRLARTLTPQLVHEIRYLGSSGKSSSEISHMLPVGHAAAWSVLKGRTWRHLKTVV